MTSELEPLLNHWPHWLVPERPILKKKFDAGLNHTTALLGSSQGDYVIKCFSGSKFANELAAQQWAAELGIAPNVRYYSNEHAYCIMDVAGDDSLAQSLPEVAQNNSLSTAQISQLAKALKKLHSVDIKKDQTTRALAQQLGRFDILSWCDVYLPNAGRTAQSLHQQLLPIMNSYLGDGSSLCLCHNDLVAANCFASSEAALFIDWEFSQCHNPWFDLAAIIYYLKLDNAQIELFIANYDPNFSAMIDSDVFFSSQCALLWGDILWHLNEFGESFWSQLEQKRFDLFKLASKFGVTLLA